MNDLKIYDVERLIKQLENPIRSAKSKAAQQLSTLNIFPSLISNSDQFIQDVITPISFYISDNTESVREYCLKTIEKYFDDLYNQIKNDTPCNLSDIFLVIIPKLCARLKNENIENSEQIRQNLLKFLLKLVKTITNTTIPNNLDSFIEGIIDALTLSFQSKEPEMKKIGCDLLNELLTRCTQDKLSLLSENLSPLIFSNCYHHHYEIRKKSLHSLALLYTSSGTFINENNENLNISLQKLSEDRNSNVRKEVIFFCSTILTQHRSKKKLYFPLLIPLLHFSSSIVPSLQIEVYEFRNKAQIQTNKITDEAKLSFNALNEIGLKYLSNNEIINQRIFDELNGFIANNGIVQIICDFSSVFLETLLFMIVDWTENRRKYGFSALITFLQLCGSYSQRYSPHIMQNLLKSLHDHQENVENALQCQAILSSFLPIKEITDFLCPRIVNEGPKEIILLLTVSVINSNNNSSIDDQLDSILNKCLSVKIYENINLIEFLVQLILSLIHKSQTFAEKNSVHLSFFILKISENTDALKCFLNAFNKPLSTVFDENLQNLLNSEEKTPMFLKILLETCSKEAILKYQDQINIELSDFLKSKPADKAIIENIINNIQQKIA